MRLVVYTDYLYRDVGGVVYGERAFVRFLGALAQELGGFTLLGRLDRRPGPARYALDPAIEFVALPQYARLTDVVAVVQSVPGTLAGMWRALDEADVVWSLGPQPHAIALALVALLRRRRLVLGVRQDFPSYVRHRHRGKRHLHLAAWLLEGVWRMLSMRNPVVAVGPELARRYHGALEITVSLITSADVRAGADTVRDCAGERLTLLSVSRLDAEKDPLLLAEVLAALRERDRRWRLLVCGEGDLADALRARLDRLGLTDYCELLGYVPFDRLLDLYRDSDVFLHVSRTEGFPQVLVEAYARGLPTVATAVGGVRSLGDSSLLVEPGDAVAAAASVQAIADDGALRARLLAAGLSRAAGATIEAQVSKLACFIAG